MTFSPLFMHDDVHAADRIAENMIGNRNAKITLNGGGFLHFPPA